MVRVLVALRPYSYQDAIARALKHARPLATVSTSDPEVLDWEARYLEPHVIICNQAPPPVPEYVFFCWVELHIDDYSDRLQTAVVTDGEAQTVPNISLAKLVSIIDEAEAFLVGEREERQLQP